MATVMEAEVETRVYFCGRIAIVAFDVHRHEWTGRFRALDGGTYTLASSDTTFEKFVHSIVLAMQHELTSRSRRKQ